MATLTTNADEAINLVATLAQKTGKTTDAVLIEALERQLIAEQNKSNRYSEQEYISSDPLDIRLARIRQAQFQFSQLPLPEGMDTDEWMYDDYGLPR
jgi:hypothetical protein